MSRLLSVALLCVAAVAAPAQTMPPAQDQKLAHDLYQEMIAVHSGYTTGSTTPVVEAVAARLRTAGFPDADVFVGGVIPKKMNLVVRLHGTGKHRPLLLIAHTDVVEANPADWSTDPFTLTEKNGNFYGRGTSDDKDQATAWIATLIRMKREGFVPDRDIIVALTADEEGGGPYSGVNFLLKNHRELIDAEYALNEGGNGDLSQGKKISNDIQVSEKYLINFRFEVHNKGGHSSVPVPDNAIYHLAGALTRLAAFGFPLKPNEATTAYFHQMEKIETGEAALAVKGFDAASHASVERAAAASPTWNSMLRTTCVATQLEGGIAINALPQMAAANVNCRVLPEDSPEYVLSTLKRIVADDKVSVAIMGEVGKAPGSPLNPQLLKAVTEVTAKLWPGVPIVPTLVPYATDGRYLRAEGIPTYGVQGFFLDRDDIPFHRSNEYLGVSSFYEGITFSYELVKALATDEK